MNTELPGFHKFNYFSYFMTKKYNLFSLFFCALMNVAVINMLNCQIYAQKTKCLCTKEGRFMLLISCIFFYSYHRSY